MIAGVPVFFDSFGFATEREPGKKKAGGAAPAPPDEVLPAESDDPDPAIEGAALDGVGDIWNPLTNRGEGGPVGVGVTSMPRYTGRLGSLSLGREIADILGDCESDALNDDGLR